MTSAHDSIFRFFSGTRCALPQLSEQVTPAAGAPAPNIQQRTTTLFGAGTSVGFFGTRVAAMNTAGYQEADAFHLDGILGNIGADRRIKKSSAAVQKFIDEELDDHQEHLLQTLRFFDERICIASDLAAGTGAKQFGIVPVRKLFHFVHDQEATRRNFYTMVSPDLPLDMYFDIDGTFIDVAERDYWAGLLLPEASNPATLPGSSVSYHPLRLACDHVVMTILSGIVAGIAAKLPPHIVVEQVAVFDSCRVGGCAADNGDDEAATAVVALPPSHKISFHVHIRLWNSAEGHPAMFRNVAAVKAFVMALLDDFRAEAARRDQQEQKLHGASVAAGERRERQQPPDAGDDGQAPQTTTSSSPYQDINASPRLWLHFIDPVVYTAWRPFRLPFCAKRGADATSGATLIPRVAHCASQQQPDQQQQAAGLSLSGTGRVTLEAYLDRLRCEHSRDFRIVMPAKKSHEDDAGQQQQPSLEERIREQLTYQMQRVYHEMADDQATAGVRVMFNLVLTAVQEMARSGFGVHFPVVAGTSAAAGYLWLALSMSVIVRPEYRRRLGIPHLPATFIGAEDFSALAFDPFILGMAKAADGALQQQHVGAQQRRQQLPLDAGGNITVTTEDGQQVQMHPASAATGGRWVQELKSMSHSKRVSVSPTSHAYRVVLGMFRAIAPQYQAITRLTRVEYMEHPVRSFYVHQKMSHWCERVQREHKTAFVQLYITYGGIKLRCYSDDCGNAKCSTVEFIGDAQGSVPESKEALRCKYRDMLFPDLGLEVVRRRYNPRTAAGDILEMRVDSGATCWTLVLGDGVASVAADRSSNNNNNLGASDDELL